MIRRTPRVVAAMLAALAPVLHAVPVTAQDTAAAAQLESPHAALYDAMEAGRDRKVMFDRMIAQVVAAFRASNPAVAAMEQRQPGSLAALMVNMRPTIERYSDRVRADYRPRMIAEIARVLSAEEAAALAEFYRSPLGLRLIRLASANVSVASAGEAVANGEAVTAADVSADLARSGQQAVATLSEAELEELGSRMLATPGFAKLPRLMANIAPLRAQMEASPLFPAEARSLDAAVAATIKQFEQ